MVPGNVFDAYNRYFRASLAQANATGLIHSCGGYNQVLSICGSNFYMNSNNVPYPNACNMMSVKSEGDVAAAKATLLSLYPPSINITLQGGGIAVLPTAITVNNCKGTATDFVAVCSFVSPGDVFWLASPWFNNRFTVFDMRAPNRAFAGSVGTMHWSSNISACDF